MLGTTIITDRFPGVGRPISITHHRICGKLLVVQAEDIAPWHQIALPQPVFWVNRSDLASKLSTALERKVFQLFENDLETKSSSPVQLTLSM